MKIVNNRKKKIFLVITLYMYIVGISHFFKAKKIFFARTISGNFRPLIERNKFRLRLLILFSCFFLYHGKIVEILLRSVKKPMGCNTKYIFYFFSKTKRNGEIFFLYKFVFLWRGKGKKEKVYLIIFSCSFKINDQQVWQALKRGVHISSYRHSVPLGVYVCPSVCLSPWAAIYSFQDTYYRGFR